MDPVLSVGTPRRGWWPGLGVAFMYLVFGGIALMLILTTASEIPAHPWVLILDVVAFFPVAVVYTATRLIGRYAMHLYANGDVEIVQPFRTRRLTAAEVVGVSHNAVRNAATGATMTWLHFIGHDQKVLLTTSTQPFPPADTRQFIEAIAARHPDLQVSGNLVA
jgi:hypothetical protein